MADVTTGPYAAGCPAPTEVDCVVVEKIYASCVTTVNATDYVMIPPGCVLPVTCAVDLPSSTCYVGAVTTSSVTNISNITYVVGAVVNITCSNGTTTTDTIYSTVTVPLYNPSGTTASCTILSAACTCVPLNDMRLQCTVTLCLLLQTSAAVQLLIPTYGFCQPGPCEVGPVLPCPPVPIYPPQLGM